MEIWECIFLKLFPRSFILNLEIIIIDIYIYIYINIYTGSINDDRLAFQVFINHVVIQMYIKLRHDLSILFLLLVL